MFYLSLSLNFTYFDNLLCVYQNQNIQFVKENMESKKRSESYVEYEFYDVPPTAITAAPSHRGSKVVVPQIMNDEEYFYETPFSYNNRHTSCTRPDIVYYDADPDYFEPEGEYIIDQTPHVQRERFKVI